MAERTQAFVGDRGPVRSHWMMFGGGCPRGACTEALRLPHLFRRHAGAGGAAGERAEGTGLGLVICRGRPRLPHAGTRPGVRGLKRPPEQSRCRTGPLRATCRTRGRPRPDFLGVTTTPGSTDPPGALASGRQVRRHYVLVRAERANHPTEGADCRHASVPDHARAPARAGPERIRAFASATSEPWSRFMTRRPIPSSASSPTDTVPSVPDRDDPRDTTRGIACTFKHTLEIVKRLC